MKLADVYQHSMVIAADYRIPDPAHVRSLLEGRKDALAAIGAHHVLVYRSIRERDRVLVMIGVRSREPVVDLVRSRAFFDWFDAAGVQDFPAVFAGEIVDRYELRVIEDGTPAGPLIAATVPVRDAAWLMGDMHSARARFEGAGVQKVWIFQAFDDAQEVLILQELDSEASAWRWIKRHGPAAPWMDDAGLGVYPPLFVGEYVEMMRLDQTGCTGA